MWTERNLQEYSLSKQIAAEQHHLVIWDQTWQQLSKTATRKSPKPPTPFERNNMSTTPFIYPECLHTTNQDPSGATLILQILNILPVQQNVHFEKTKLRSGYIISSPSWLRSHWWKWRPDVICRRFLKCYHLGEDRHSPEIISHHILLSSFHIEHLIYRWRVQGHKMPPCIFQNGAQTGWSQFGNRVSPKPQWFDRMNITFLFCCSVSFQLTESSRAERDDINR